MSGEEFHVGRINFSRDQETSDRISRDYLNPRAKPHATFTAYGVTVTFPPHMTPTQIAAWVKTFRKAMEE